VSTTLWFFWDCLIINIVHRPLISFLTHWNPRLFLEYFQKRMFEANYIFHWQKTRSIYTALPEPSSHFTVLGRFIKLFKYQSLNETIKGMKGQFYLSKFLKVYLTQTRDVLLRTFGFGFIYIRGVAFLLFIDACLTDDEPLWEPIEWSLVQTWILFIFTFAWIAENLIVSRYGSFTGRDKRVWISWYKTFWLIEGYYAFNYGVVCIFVMLPFYFEINYDLCFVYSWWNWYSRVFFFKFIALYTIVLLCAYLLQLGSRWLNWKKGLIYILMINIFIVYLLFTHFIMVFFGYFTDPLWYQKNRPVDYIQLSHEPSRWGWGPAKKDHYTYHNVKTVFWFKQDGPFASSFLMFHLFFFVCIFLLLIFWLSLLRRVWATKEMPITFTTYCVSALRQFFYFFFFLYGFVFFSYMFNYFRLPPEFFFFIDTSPWLTNFIKIIVDYPHFLYKYCLGVFLGL
jgi:hypothetical protein